MTKRLTGLLLSLGFVSAIGGCGPATKQGNTSSTPSTTSTPSPSNGAESQPTPTTTPSAESQPSK